MISRPSRRIRVFAICGISFVLGAGIIGLFALRDAMAVRQKAASAVSGLKALERRPQLLTTHEGRRDVARELDRAAEVARIAGSEIDHSLALSIVGAIPYVGRLTAGAQSLANDAAATALLSKSFVGDLDRVASSRAGAPIDWDALNGLIANAAAMRTQLGRLQHHGGGLWGPVGEKRAEFNRALTRLRNRLRGVIAGGNLATNFLGIHRPTHVLFLAANNAEMRAEGAFLSYALVDFSGGKISRIRTGSLAELEQGRPLSTYPPTAAMLVSNGSTRLWSAINMTANFRWTGEVAASKLATVQGRRPDFVVGVDVVTLRALLSVEGPVRIPSLPQPITEQNVAQVLLRSLYETFTPTERSQRLGVLSEVIVAALSRASQAPANTVDVAKALSGQIGGRHLLFWSGNPALEESIRALGASGELTGSRRNSTFSVAVESAVAAKMDAFDVVTALNYKVEVQPDRSATIDLSVTIENHAPKHLRPGSYIYGPDGWNAHRPGEYVANVFVWSPPVGAELSAPRDGGLALRATSVDLDPDESGIVHFSSKIPPPKSGQHLWLRLVPQPRLQPTMTTITVDDGSHHKSRRFSLDSVMEMKLAE